MKCKCGMDMREWQRAMVEGQLVIRYTCDNCGHEEAEIESPKRYEPPKKKED